jgi:hypothetical protein
MTLRTEINETIARTLQQHDVLLTEPRDQMLQLSGVVVGSSFSKHRTNVLLRRRGLGDWDMFVDEDLCYLGSKRERQKLFCGPGSCSWRKLDLRRSLRGDVNQAIIAALGCLQSPLRRGMLGRPVRRNSLQATSTPRLSLGSRDVTHGPTIVATPTQCDLVDRVAETVCRGIPPTCPLIIGPPGCGKTTIGQRAASALVERGLARSVLCVSGAEISSQALSRPDRDQQLAGTLRLLLDDPDRVIVIEHVDYLFDRSLVAAALVADALDQGLRAIGVASCYGEELEIGDHQGLRRRLDPVFVPSLEPTEVDDIVQRRLATHPLAVRLEVAPDVLPAVVRLSRNGWGAQPGGALGLLEAVLMHAAWVRRKCVGPDDVYHLCTAEAEPA